jgi:hypothetical protein
VSGGTSEARPSPHADQMPSGMMSGVCSRACEKSKRFIKSPERAGLFLSIPNAIAIVKPDPFVREGHRGILSGPNRFSVANGWERLAVASDGMGGRQATRRRSIAETS